MQRHPRFRSAVAIRRRGQLHQRARREIGQQLAGMARSEPARVFPQASPRPPRARPGRARRLPVRRSGRAAPAAARASSRPSPSIRSGAAPRPDGRSIETPDRVRAGPPAHPAGETPPCTMPPQSASASGSRPHCATISLSRQAGVPASSWRLPRRSSPPRLQWATRPGNGSPSMPARSPIRRRAWSAGCAPWRR